MARPSKYHSLVEEGLIIRVEGWAKDGLTDEQIATNIGINKTTLYEWKKKYEEFSNALKKNKDLADREVESSLFKNATGYDYTEQQGFKLKRVYYDDEGKRCEEERLETIDVKKHKPPETTAQIFWLKNRKPADWRDKQQVEHSGETTHNINNDLSKLSVEELKQIESILSKTD